LKQLVLHPGMAKTGTSSIQDTLGNSIEALREHDVYYPPWRPFNHSYELSALFRRNPVNSFYYKQFAPESEEAWEAEAGRLRDKWSDFFQSFSEGTCIVSAESMEQFSVEEITALVEFASPYFDQCRAILYVRDPLSAIKSRWEQSVKELEQPVSGETLLENAKRRIHFRALRRWGRAMGEDRILVRSFKPEAFFNGNLLDDFFHCAGLPQLLDAALDSQESNTSLGKAGTAFLLQFNGRYPLYRDGRLNPERALADNPDLLYSLIRELSPEQLSLDVRFSEEEAQAINDEIRYVNQFMGQADQFSEVVASTRLTDLPDPAEVPPEFLLDLVNGLSLRLERVTADLQHQSREVARLKAENASLLAELEELRPPQEEQGPVDD
jgi:hypothetical protein